MRGHILEVKGIVFSPRGDIAVSTSADRTVRLWDVATGKCRSVLRDFQNWVCDIDWLETPDANYLVVGCYDGEVRMWKVEEDGKEYNLRLFWRKTKGELTVKDTIIQDVQGLSQLNKQLLKQRGAEGDPADRFCEVNENVMKMASVVTKIEATSNEAAQDPSSSRPGISMEQLERRVEQVTDPLLRGLVAAFVRDIHG
jgi:WD40 repeat protein